LTSAFANLHLHPDLLAGIRELGFSRPTPIQAEAIPPALAGRESTDTKLGDASEMFRTIEDELLP
jgi:ATP-dependent RNA helicase RhlE